MRLPEAEQAVVGRTKVREYLLSMSHPVGRFKAAFFRSLGYSASDWNRLANDLRGVAKAGDALLAESTPYGEKYTVEAILVGPSGERASVVTVWLVPVGDSVPRLVTAYPGVEA